jgi:hypothetical protein
MDGSEHMTARKASSPSPTDYHSPFEPRECEAIQNLLAQAVRDRVAPVLTPRQAWVIFNWGVSVAAYANVLEDTGLWPLVSAHVHDEMNVIYDDYLPEWRDYLVPPS